MASSSTSYEVGNKYSVFDVFINHRGPDVKKGLATHLYRCLRARGLKVFLDCEELQAGDSLTPQIKGAIETASIHIAIFSPQYAESTWCLDELVQMLESEKTIIPVFYKVNPSELRWTRGADGVYTRAVNTPLFILLSMLLCILLRIPPTVPLSILLCIFLCTRNRNGVYARALRKLEEKTTFDFQANKQKPRYDSHTIEKWRNTLKVVSHISGFDLNAYNGDEGQLVQKIEERVWDKVGKTPLNVAKYPTGLHHKVQDFEIKVLSQQQREKTTVVGIVGLGGVGKTTLAKEIFNRHRSNYDQCCFLFDVREKAAKSSLNLLQSTLLRDLAQRNLHISSTDEGIEKLKSTLSPSQRVLVVLDDVDDISQLDALFFPIKDTINSGSLILVTSRNKGLLKRSGIGESFIYKQTGLNKQHSKELFCLHAFNNPYPGIGFEPVVKMFLDICCGLPLSLQVIGALLCHEDLEYWEAQLHKISEIPPEDILARLKVSYDSLEHNEKQIFLDIACFFIGENRDTVIRIWDGSRWQGWLGLRNLENRCLVEVDSENKIKMHDHLRDLGRDIAKKETPHRLWRSDDILADQSSVRGITMVHRNVREQCFEIPTNMRGLQLLKAEGESVEKIIRAGHPTQLTQLVWLNWYSCPFRSLPCWISLKNLRVLHIQGKELETLWQPESQAPLQLRELHIYANYFTVPKSIGTLKQLEKFVLHLKPERMRMVGQLTDRDALLPAEVGCMNFLKHFELHHCRYIMLIPHSAGNWNNLQYISLVGCNNLRGLPDSARSWTNLRSIDLGRCAALQGLPDSAGSWTNLRSIDLGRCAPLQGLPDSAGSWTNLQSIDLGRCAALQGLPDSAGSWTNLQSIDLYRCAALQGLPDSAGSWTNLQSINLGGCAVLQGLPDSAGSWTNLQSINLAWCDALQGLLDSAGSWTNLQSINLAWCDALQGLPDSAGSWTNLQSINLGGCDALQGLPDSAGSWTNLQSIDLAWCPALQGLPDSAGSWTNLRSIYLHRCPALQGLPDSAGSWTNLQSIDLRGCDNFQWDGEVLELLRQRAEVIC